MAARILAFAGSLRTGSLNKKLAHIAAEAARRHNADVTEIDLRDYPLPLYDGDIEAAEGLPENARKLKALFLDHHGLLIACPEYNSSITAVLKNVIDWVSRPVPGEKPLAAFDGKVAALLAASPGALGGLRGLVTVRSILSNIKTIVLPEQYALVKADTAFAPDGQNLADAKQQAIIDALAGRLVQVAARLNG